MEGQKEEQEKKHLEFKRKGFILLAFRKKSDNLFKDGKISNRKKNKIKEKLKYEWRKAYNRHPYISQSVKQGFNLLYT